MENGIDSFDQIDKRMPKGYVCLFGWLVGWLVVLLLIFNTRLKDRFNMHSVVVVVVVVVLQTPRGHIIFHIGTLVWDYDWEDI